jgi:hypothetical protein
MNDRTSKREMKNMWKSRVFQSILGLALVVVLCLAMVLPAMAENSASPTPATSDNGINLVKGKVAVIGTSPESFQVSTSVGDTVAITVDSNTKYYLISGTPVAVAKIKTQVQERLKNIKPNLKNMRDTQLNTSNKMGNNGKNGKGQIADSKIVDSTEYEDDSDMAEVLTANSEFQPGIWGKFKSIFNSSPKLGQKAAFSDLAVGDGVIVKVMPDENLAKQVLIIKAPDVKTIKGNITDVSGDVFTITSVNAQNEPVTVTLKIDANSRVVIRGSMMVKTGQYAVVVYKETNLTVKVMDVFPSAPGASPTASATDGT